MEKFILEACVDSVESAEAAIKGGATRLELCADIIIGGTTPGQHLFSAIRKISDIPIHVLIRPRFGDFCYTDHEFSIIREDIISFQKLGAEGVVFGVLLSDGTLDLEKMKILMEASGDMSVTLHRAFDVALDPYETLDTAISLGVNTILTSGQKNTALNGTGMIGELVDRASGRIDILVGGGISADTIEKLYPLTKATSYHMTGKVIVPSVMKYKKKDVNMGLPGIGEFEIWRTKEQNIREAYEVLARL